MLFAESEEKVGWVKAGFLGFGGSGKTYTAILLAAAIHKTFKCKTPVAFFDTETGFVYTKKTLQNLTGIKPISVASRSFGELMTGAMELRKAGTEILIVDSMTHIWRELCSAYLSRVNAARATKNQKPRTKLEFQDWNPIKQEWAKWADFFLTSSMHIIICGRAGYDYDFEVNEETERKELVKTGIKMKTEGEFGYEPSLLVSMEQVQKLGDNIEVANKALVLKDRFNLLQGKTATFKPLGSPEKEMTVVSKFFEPFLKSLNPGAAVSLDTTTVTELNIDESGDAEWAKERRLRTIAAEEIQGELVKAYPGQTKEEKQAKMEIIEKCFGTTSWTKVENMDSQKLAVGLTNVRVEIANRNAVTIPDIKQ